MKSRKSRIMILCYVPALLLAAMLLFLCIKPLSVYVQNCYFEAFVAIACWILFWGLIFIWKRLSDSHPINMAIVMASLGLTMLVSYPYIKHIAKGRYVFYRYGLYSIPHSDIGHVRSAMEALKCKEWESARLHMDSCSKNGQKFFSYSMKCVRNKVGIVETSKQNFAKIIEEYKITPSVLALYASMATDVGGTFNEEFLRTKQQVKAEIDSIEVLYDAICAKDDSLCRLLVHQHGRYWFEAEVLDMILNADDCVRTLELVVMKEDYGQQYKKMLKYAWGF